MRKDVEMIKGVVYDKALAYNWGKDIYHKRDVSHLSWKTFGRYWREVAVKTYILYRGVKEDMDYDDYSARQVKRLTSTKSVRKTNIGGCSKRK